MRPLQLLIVYLILFAVYGLYFWYAERSLLKVEQRIFLVYLALLPWAVRASMPAILKSRPAVRHLFSGAAILIVGWRLLEKSIRMGSLDPRQPHKLSGIDQWNYYNMAEKISDWSLAAKDYTYGIAYPALGAAFAWLTPTDPFLPVNVICFVLTIAWTYRAMLELGLPWGLCISSAGLFAFAPYLLSFSIAPWSSTLSMACFAGVVYLCFKKKALTVWDYLIFGGATGLMFAARYADVVLSAPLGAVLIAQEWKRSGSRAPRKVLPGVLLALLLIGGVFYSHKAILGGYLRNPYQWHHHPNATTTDGDFSYYLTRLGPVMVVSPYSQLIESKTADPEYQTLHHLKESLFQRHLLFLFAPAGLLLLWRGRRIDRARYAGLLAGAGLFFLIYASHPGTCSSCLVFSSLHYFKSLSILFLISGAYFMYLLFRHPEEHPRLLRYGLGNLAVYGVAHLLVRYWT